MTPLPPPLLVEYTAPANCPTQSEFEARVRARTELARFADEPNAQTLQVVVRPTGVSYAGHLSIVGRSGRTSERDVEDTLCENVVDALALVTAIAVDPAAMLAPPEEPRSTPPPTPSVAPVAPAAPDAAPEETPNSPRVPKVPLLAAPDPAGLVHRVDPADAAESRPLPSRWAAALGGSFVAMSGIAPDAMAGGAAFGEVEPKSSGWLVPAARLTVFAAENGVFEARKASFLLLAARVDVCPVRIGSGDASLRACMGADLGATRAAGLETAVAEPASSVDPWFDAAALLRARWAPAHGRVFAEIEGGLVLPITRNTFVYKPDETIDHPTLAATGSLAVGAQFR